MIIAKYFQSNKDYTNVMKVTKKYRELVEGYYLNPISDFELFNNMETQYLYELEDYKTPGMHQYVYW